MNTEASPPTADASMLSVVIATRDRPELLRRAIDAVEAQTWPGRIETICVFDQSEPHATLEHSTGNRSVRVMVNSRTPGLAGARNTGALAASGRWLAFCDDDDEWLPRKIDEQLARLDEVPEARLATCGVTIRFDAKDHDRIPTEAALTFDGFLRDRMTEVHPSSFVMDRAWFCESLGLVDEALPGSYAEDYDVLLRAARLTTIVSVPEPLVRVHWHPSTYFRDRWTMIDGALGYLVDKFPEFAAAPRGLARIRGQQAFARAAAGNRRGALHMVRQTVRLSPIEPRAAIALCVIAGVPARRVLSTLHRFGRGL